MSESLGESVGEKRKEMMGSPNAHAVREFCSLRGKDEPVHKSVRESVLQNTNYRLPPEKTLKVDEKSAFGQQIMERIKSDWHVNEQAWRKELQSQENFTQVRSVRNKNGHYDYFDKQTARIVSSQEYEARYGLFLRSRTRDGASHQGNSNSGNGCSSISNGDGGSRSRSISNVDGGSSSSSINENGGSSISNGDGCGSSSSSNVDGGSSSSNGDGGSSNDNGGISISTASASTPVCAYVNSTTNGSCDSISSDSSSNDSEGSNRSNISSLPNTGQVSVEKTPPPTPSSTPIDAAADKENTTLASPGPPAPPSSSKRSGTPVPTPPSASGSKDPNSDARHSTKPHTPRSALFTVQDPSQDALHENAGDPPPVKANVGAVRPSTPCGVM